MAKGKKAEKKYTAEDIISMVDKKLKSKALVELFDQMEGDFDLYELVEYEAEKGHESYTSPKPRNDFQKIFSSINKASLTWQIVVPEDAPEVDRESASKGERIITGVLDKADRNLRNTGKPPLRQGATWFECNRGMVGGKCLIYANKKKEVEIDIQYLDPLHMAWEQGVEHLVWGAYESHISSAEANDRYNLEIEDREEAIRVIDFFDRRINAVVVSYGSTGEKASKMVKEPTLHELGHVPMFVGFVGGMPPVFRKNHTSALASRAMSVYASSRKIYEPFNKQVSFIMDIAEKSVAGTLLHRSIDGKKMLQDTPFNNWGVINVEKDETIEPLMPPKVPAESGLILSIIDRDKQESTVPFPIGYGLDPQAHSGAALAMVNENMRSIYDPFACLLEDFYHWLCEEVLVQFKQKGQTMNLKGFNTDGKFFAQDANPDDIQDDWYIRVTCEPKLPRDEAGELQMALAATQARPPDGRPLISDYTALEKIIKIQSPDAEDKRIEEQQIKRMIEKMPQLQIRKIANALLEKGDREGALEFLAMIPAPPGAQGMPQQGGQPPMGAPPVGGLGGAPGQVAGGPPPQISPEDMAMAQQLAQQLMQEGKPIPPELQAVLAMGQQGG